MSLFENDLYRWRETYFVMFDESNRPTIEAAEQALANLGGRYEVSEIREDEGGYFESLTLISPYDFAAMDISYLSGEDVTSHVDELLEEMRDAQLSKEEKAKLEQIRDFNARFDIYHFERLVEGSEDEEDEFMDPGSLLIVLESLARLCRGVGIDPQSGTVM